MGLMDLVKKAFLGATDEENRKNESHTEASFGFCKVSNPETTLYFHPITYEPALAGKGKYSVAVTQSSAEVAEFKNFFKKGL